MEENKHRFSEGATELPKQYIFMKFFERQYTHSDDFYLLEIVSPSR